MKALLRMLLNSEGINKKAKEITTWISREGIPGTVNTKCKGPEVGAFLACL